MASREERQQKLREYLCGVDEVAPDADVIEAMITVLNTNGVFVPQDLVGVTEEEVAGCWPSDNPDGKTSGPPLGRRAFLRRAARLANTTLSTSAPSGSGGATAMELSLPGGAAQPQQPVCKAAPELQELLGVANAMDIATELSATVAESDSVADILSSCNCNLADLSYLNIPDESIFRAMKADSLHSAKASKQKFTYIDLCSKVLLPMWLPYDAVGGRVPAQQQQAEASSSTLEALSTALQHSKPAHRTFRSYQQWLSCFLRYAVVAIGTGQLTLSQVISYLATITRLSEESRIRGQAMLAVHYDAEFRRSVAARAKCGDKVDLDKEFAKIDEDILEASKAKLRLSNQHRDDGSGPPVGADAKAAAASQKMAAQLEATKKELREARQQQQNRVMAASSPNKSGNDRQEYSDRQTKRFTRFKQMQTWKKSKSGGKGK